jgi:hypothetical protein
MTRGLAACVVLITVGPINSAPRLKDEPARVYFPMTVGDRWVVELRYKTTSEEYTEVVTAIEKKDGATVVTVGREADGKAGPPLSHVKVADDGLYRMSHLGTTYDPPYRILKFPLKPGQAWTSEAGSGGTVRSTFKYKAIHEEDVEVPAGKYRAFRIEVDIDTQGRTRKSVIWYAPRVGIVKMDHEDGDSGYVRVLKSFQPGGKK